MIFTALFILPFGDGAVRANSSEEGMNGLLRAYVAQGLSVDPSEIEVGQLRVVGQKTLPDGKITEVKAVRGGRLLGRVIFVVTLSQDNGVSSEQWVSADVQQVREVLVARRTLHRLDILEQEDVAFQSMRVRHQRARYATDLAQVIGKRLTQSLRKGMPIRSVQLEEAPLIRRGERVTITFRSGGLKIITAGEAKQDGRLGETIKVVNLDSQKMIFAEVFDSGDVRIEQPK